MKHKMSKIKEMVNDRYTRNNFCVIDTKSNQSLVSDAGRKSRTLGSTINAGNPLNLVCMLV